MSEAHKSDHYQTVGTTHDHQPDYSRPLLQLSPQQLETLLSRLTFLYGQEVAREYMPELERILKVYYAHKPPNMIENDQKCNAFERFTEEDIILITYGDLLRKRGQVPLVTLANFCDTFLEGTINTLHLLPFFPYSSDKGFSVIDFITVDPKLGSWEDIEDLEKRYQLMFDGVFNHISSKSRWFQEFLNDKAPYKNFFITYNSPDELSEKDRNIIFRPRTSNILTEFQTINGPKWVWTTFSGDQIDLNFKNPKVLMRVIETLLLYVRHGADIIRLDAVTYLWAEEGTRCIHLDQTHEIVKLFRDIFDLVAPGVAIITETNVPHEENISYFGNGHDEAHMVYNFALPPLVLFSFYREDTTKLSEWASTLNTPSPTTTYFNFLDSHDGIGLMGVKSILELEEIDMMLKRAFEHGGLISFKTTRSGNKEPYEINMTWYSALNKEDADEDLAYQVKRFVASRSIALVLKGIPGIYLHSLLGTENDVQAVLTTKSNRDINRTVIDLDSLKESLNDEFSKFSRISREMGRLIKIRTSYRAFHPNAHQKVLSLSPDIFAVLRVSPEEDQHICALTNVTNNISHITINLDDLNVPQQHWYDVVSNVEWLADDNIITLTMLPYDVIWLVPFDEKIKN